VTAAVDVETASVVVQDFDELEPEEYSTAILSSASVPFVFPYTEFKGRKLMDSLSIGWNVNMIGAIEKCLDQVDDHSKIILDVMVMYPNKIEIRMPDGDYNTIHNYFRQRDFEEYYSLLSDIEEFIRAYPDI
jgi:hypothetical protein